MTPPLVIPSYPKLSPLIGLIGMGGGATSRRFYTASSSDETYNIEKSLKFNDPDSPYLKRNIKTYGNARTWTYSCWIKLADDTEDAHFLGGYVNSSNRDNFYLGGDNWFGFNMKNNNNWHVDKVTDMKFKDTNAWQHLVIRWDTLQGQTKDRARFYINGKEVTWGGGLGVTDPAQNAESIINQGDSIFYIGAGPNNDGSLQTSYWGGMISDAQFIDGLSLSPASFGSFDSANNWNPRSLTLPSYNDGTTWSSSVTGATDDADHGHENLFDGYLGSAFNTTLHGKRLFTYPSSNTTNTFTPSSPIVAKQQIRVWAYRYDAFGQFWWNGVDHTDTIKNVLTAHSSVGWVEMPTRTLTSMAWRWVSGVGIPYMGAIEVDGVILVDGKTDATNYNNPNDGRTWSDDLSATGGINDADRTFNGLVPDAGSAGALTYGVSQGGTMTFAPTGGIVFKDTVELYTDQGSTYTVNGGSSQTFGPATGQSNGIWYTVATGGGTLTSLTWTPQNASYYPSSAAIRIDGHLLLDTKLDNSFHLKFNDTEDVGVNSFLHSANFPNQAGAILKVKTGADDGYALDSGVNTDLNKSNLVLAIAGNTIADISHTVKGSGSAVALTTNGSVATSTTQSKFYGTSMYFDGDGDYIDTAAISTADAFCMEYWMRPDIIDGMRPFNGSDDLDGSYYLYTELLATGAIKCRQGALGIITTADWKIKANTWHHIAYTYDGTTQRVFIDGVLEASGTGSWTPPADMKFRLGADESNAASGQYKGYIQDARFYFGNAKYTTDFTPTGNFKAYNLNAPWETVPGKFVLFNNSTDNLTDDKVDNVTVTNNSSVTTASAPTNPHGISTMASFDGTNYLSTNFANPIGNGSAATLDVWWDHSEANTQSTGTSRSLMSNGNGGYIEINGSNSGGQTNVYLYGSTSVDLGAFEWGHFRVTWDGTTTTAYWNGVQKYQGTATCSAGNITLGGNESGNYLWEGKLGPVIFTDGNLGAPPAGGLPAVDGEFTVTNSEHITLPVAGDADIDVLTDSPTNSDLEEVADTGKGGEISGNFCTWNPLMIGDSSTQTFSEGNLEWKNDGADAWTGGTLGVKYGSSTTNKWYWEVTIKHGKGGYGICTNNNKDNDHTSWGGGTDRARIYLSSNGKLSNPAGGSDLTYGSNTTCVVGDTVGVALDLSPGGSNGTITFYKNGTSLGQAHSDIDTSKYWTVFANDYGENPVGGVLNTGQRAFKYTAPTDHKCLCTANFKDTFGDNEDTNNPSKYCDATVWTGDGSSPRTLSMDNGDFTPDLVWFKNRDTAGRSHYLYDAVRTFGSQKELVPNSNVEEGSSGHLTQNHGYLSSVGAGTLTFGAGATNDEYTNKDGDNFFAWNWDAGTAASGANTNGTINIASGDQWVNDAAGFSITKFTGTGADATFGHGLSAKPEFLVIKKTSSTGGDGDWTAQHVGATLGSGRLIMNENYSNDTSNSDTYWNSTAPTSTVVSIGDHQNTNTSGQPHICYAWRSVAGYSAFGSYTGNANAQGPFVYLGFRPRMIIFKNISTTNGWRMQDTAVNTYNPFNTGVYPNTSDTEDSPANWTVDYLSNGFKVRDSNNELNGSGNTIIYMAWAENPFKVSRAR